MRHRATKHASLHLIIWLLFLRLSCAVGSQVVPSPKSAILTIPRKAHMLSLNSSGQLRVVMCVFCCANRSTKASLTCASMFDDGICKSI